MPEGDTIWRTAGRLRPALAGHELLRFEALRLIGDRPRLGGQIDDVEAVGKHLLVHFADGLSLDTHMRMTGSWHLYRVDERWRKASHLVRCIIGVVRIPGRGDDASDHRAKTPEQATCLRLTAKEAEVVAVHDDRIEAPKLGPDVLERHHPRIQNATPPRYLDGSRGYVYCHDFAAARLQFERNASCAAARVEDAPSHKA